MKNSNSLQTREGQLFPYIPKVPQCLFARPNLDPPTQGGWARADFSLAWLEAA
jgi:hypothetical protein